MPIEPDSNITRRVVLVALLVAILSGCSSPQPDEKEVGLFVRQYIDTINSGDASKLAELLNNPAQSHDAGDRLSEAAGGPWRLTDTEVLKLSPTNFNAVLKVSSSQGRREWILPLSFADGRFVVGPLNPSGQL